jgi:methylenetetrahydrofolate reductase (NADPH)
MESQKRYTQAFSFEFFPPKTDKGREKLEQTRDALKQLGPKYVSVTFGAGGSTQQGTIETVQSMLDAGLSAAPHLSCIGSTREGIRSILDTYVDMGVERIVALRGDMPSGMGMQEAGEFSHANELVEFIRAETGDRFHLEVAAYPEFHPQAKSAEQDLRNFKRKIDAGANGAITQYFYNDDAYFRFVDDCERLGVDVPIIPGIMPIINYKQLARFSDACGAELPRWLRWRLEGFGDDLDSVRAYGQDVVAALCQRLLEAGAPGLHFYTMNQVGPTRGLWDALGLDRR